MTDGYWQLDRDAPELYQRYLVPAITEKWAADLVHRARPRRGETVLDVACGTGVVARLAAKAVAPRSVVGLDLNRGMLQVARTVDKEGSQIGWVEGSALNLPFPADTFDLVLCQLGLQFFPDQERALREMHRILSPPGRIALSVFSPIERTPGANAFVLALDRVLGPHSSTIKRGEHSFESPDQLRNLMVRAGFEAVDVQIAVQQIAFPSVRDYVRFQLIGTASAVLLKNRDDIGRQIAISELATVTAHLSTASMLRDGKFCFPQEAYVATARKCH